MNGWILRFSALLLSLIALSSAAQADKLRILTTFAPIDSLTRGVAGDAAEVMILLPPGTGPHDFSFSPADLRKVSKADIIVMNGLGIEEWMEDAIKNAAKKDVVVIDTSKGVKLIEEEPAELGDDHAEHKHDHEHEGANPHIWLDPQRAIQQVENIVRVLVEKDRANGEAYKANAAAYIRRLVELDTEIAATLGAMPDKRFITFHDSFPYFAQRYGLEIVGVFEPFPGKEPTPKYLKELAEVAKTNKVKAVFSEPQYSPKVLSTLAGDLGLKVAVLDPMETGEPGAGLYEKVMRSNLTSLQNALK